MVDPDRDFFSGTTAFGIAAATRLCSRAGFLDRIAAHATNIAEMIILLARGEDVRHLH